MFTSTTNLPERIGDPNHNCLASPPDQILTFCNSPDCLKPLCLECLAYHCMVHFQKGNQPILLEFKRLKENCTERLNRVGDYLGDLLTAIKKDQDSIPGNWGYHDIEAEKIRRSKEYLINYIEKYYKDLLDHYYLTSKPLETKLGRLYEEIKDLKVKLEENTSSSSSEVIKKVFERNFEQEIAEIRKNFPGKNVIINDKSSWTCRNNIKVEVDYSKLYTSLKDELQKYTSIVYQPACQETKASVFKKFTKTPANVFEDFKSAPLDTSAFLPRALSISKNSIYKGLAQDKPMFTRALEIKQLMESFKNGLVDIPKQMTNALLQPILEMNNPGDKIFEPQQEEKPHEDTFGVKEISSDDSIPNRAITISPISHKKHKSPEVYCIADDSSSCSFEVQELGDFALKQEAYKLEATHAAMLIEKSLEMSLRGSDFKKAAMNKAGKKSSKGGVKQEEKENLSSRMCSLDMPAAVKKRIIEDAKENMMPGREIKVLDVEIKKDGMEDLSNVSSVKVKSSNKRIALRQIQNFPTIGAGGMEEEEDDKLSLAFAMKGGNTEKSPFRIEDITPIKPVMNTEMKENMFITPNDPILRMMQGEKTNEQSKKKLLNLNVVPEENSIPAERMHLRISFTEEPEEKKVPKQEEVVKKRIEIILEDEDDDVVEEIPTEMVYKKMLPKQEAVLDEKNMVKFKPTGYGEESNLLEQGRLEQLLENDFGDDPIEEEEVNSSEGTGKKEEKKVKREEKAVKKEPQPLRRSQRKKKLLDQTSLTMEDEDCFKEVLNLMNASSKTKKEEETTTMMRSSRRQQQSKVKKEEDSVILQTPEKKSRRRRKKDTSTKTKKEESETTTISTNLASSENLEKKNSIGVANHNSMHSEEIPKTPMEEEKGPEPENVYTPTCLSPISRFEASMTPHYYMIEGQEENERGTKSAMKTVDRSFDLITPDFAVNVQDYFQSDCKNKLLHFFQWRSKNLHIISINSLDIIQRGAPFQTIALDINFEIPDYHNSLITPTGDIYLTGGQDAKNAGQKYNNVYVVSFEKNTLIPKANMLYRRDSHALCYWNGCLYALGGITVDQNGKKNVTNKCEKYIIAEDRWEEIAELNLPVCNHSASVFQDKYIFCFGGRLQPNKLSNNIFRYNLEKNTWLRLELKPTLQTQARLSLTSQAACFQINDKQIFVFGGYQANRNISSQSFLFEYCSATNDFSELKPTTPVSKMDQSTSNIGGGNKRKDDEKRGSGKRAPMKKEAMNIKRRKDVCIIKGLSKKDLPFPAPFWDKQVIADDGKIYCLQNVTMSNNPKLSYSTTRRLLVFNGNEWTSLN